MTTVCFQTPFLAREDSWFIQVSQHFSASSSIAMRFQRYLILCFCSPFIYFSKWGHAEDRTCAANGLDGGKGANGDQNLCPSKDLIENKKEEKNRMAEKNGDLNMECKQGFCNDESIKFTSSRQEEKKLPPKHSGKQFWKNEKWGKQLKRKNTVVDNEGFKRVFSNGCNVQLSEYNFVHLNRFADLEIEDRDAIEIDKSSETDEVFDPPKIEKHKKHKKRKRKYVWKTIKKLDNPVVSETSSPTVIRCRKCFKTHFPTAEICNKQNKLLKMSQKLDKKLSQNTQVCIDEIVQKLICDKIKFLEIMFRDGLCVQDLYCSSNDFKLIRLRGGAREDSVETMTMVEKAIENAKKHGINLKHGAKSVADGDCAFFSAIENMNTRKCFKSKIPFSAITSRQIWITDLENMDEKFPELCGGFSKEEAQHNWNQLKQQGVYNIDFFGDMMMYAIAKGCHKNILIFNTSPDAHSPIYVVEAKRFGGFLDSDIPIVLGYNLVHYESLHPLAELDIEKTKSLVQRYLSGQYKYSKKDIQNLISAEVKNELLTIAFSFTSFGKIIDVQIDKDLKLLCPSCTKPFQRLMTHLSSSELCNGQIEIGSLKTSMDNFTKSKKKENRTNATSKCGKDSHQAQHKHKQCSQAVVEIQTQAQHELGCHLDQTEMSRILKSTVAKDFVLKIKKVKIIFLR